MKKSIIFTVLFLLVLSQLAFSQSATLNFQGVLRGQYGNAVPDGEYNLTFRIYTQPEGGTAIWTEVHNGANAVEITNGVCSVDLGTIQPLAIGFDADYYVSVQIDDGAEMMPRTRLTTAPYAMALRGNSNKFPSDGNVGIGTASPIDKLHVLGNLRLDDTYGIIMGLSGQDRIFSDNNNNEYDTRRMKFFVHDDMVFSLTKNYNGGTNKAYFEGNVGIGTETPLQKLHVDGNIRINQDYGILMGFDESNKILNDLSDYDTHRMRFYVRNEEVFSLTKDYGDLNTAYFAGNVGIGTNAPDATLDVEGTVSILGGVQTDLVDNQAYQAASDGFVVAWSGAIDGNYAALEVNVSQDGTNYTLRTTQSNVIDWGSCAANVCCPIRKGEYWKCDITAGQSSSIQFVPFGN